MIEMQKAMTSVATANKAQRIVLLVDDDEDEHDIFLSALNNTGEDYMLVSAISSEAALKILDDLTPNAIFLDINMPRITGIKCLEEIRKIKKLSKVPVYIYSTGINSREGQRAILLGAKDYIIKPNSISDLSFVLKEILAS